MRKRHIQTTRLCAPSQFNVFQCTNEYYLFLKAVRTAQLLTARVADTFGCTGTWVWTSTFVGRTAIESANIREKIRCFSNYSIELGARALSRQAGATSNLAGWLATPTEASSRSVRDGRLTSVTGINADSIALNDHLRAQYLLGRQASTSRQLFRL